MRSKRLRRASLPCVVSQDLFRSVVELALLPAPDTSEDPGNREDMYLDDETWYSDSGFEQQQREEGDDAVPIASGDDWGWASPATDDDPGSWDGASSRKDASSAPGGW